MEKNRNIRKTMAEETLKILENGNYETINGQRIDIRQEIAYSINNTLLIKPDDEVSNALQNNKSTKIGLENRTSLAACADLSKDVSKVFCLNFASAKNPGGGFLGGSEAQEESLARSSALYATLIEKTEMYQSNRTQESCFYLDYMIYSPDVPVFRDDTGVLLSDYYKVSFLTYPAVNAGVVKQRESHRAAEIYKVMEYRVQRTLAFAKSKGYDCLVLGAWGCGVFQNDPHDIANIFKNALNGEFKGVFEHVEFAVLDRNDRGVFRAFEAELKSLL